jgi:hypothetical protein
MSALDAFRAVSILLAVMASPAIAQEGRTKSRLLYGFEQADEVASLRKSAENAELTAVPDNGVTEGKNCLRFTGRKGAPYAVFKLGPDAIKNWGDFDFLEIDVFAEDEHPYTLLVELWDAASKNYATRCTFEDVKTHPGRQTLLYPIGKARRNGKVGLDANQLRPQDRIDLNNLTQVKVFLKPRQDRDAVLWIDNIRLLQEDAAKPKLKVPLPPGALAFKFGSAGSDAPGFKTVSPQTAFQSDFGFVEPKGLTHGGEGWPDALSGTFVLGAEGKPVEFRAKVPDGEYKLWLCAGPIYRAQAKDRHFLLRANDATLADASPSPGEYYGEKYLYRFLRTQYSEKEHALWEHYIDRMYPVHVRSVKVSDGTFRIEAINHFLSAAVLVPVAEKREFDKFVAEVRRLRVAAFEQTLRPVKHKETQPRPDDTPFICYVPEPLQSIRPSTRPSEMDRKRTTIQSAAAPGQRVVMRLAVAPSADLGRCTLELADLKGPTTVPATQITGQFQNYRFDGENLGEMALIPALSLDMELGVTHCFWLWLHVPHKAAAGRYQAEFTFRPGHGSPVKVPVELEVYPFTLEEVLPVSFGMYYNPRHETGLPADTQRRLIKEQLEFMRQVGFTAVPIGAPVVTGLDRKGGVRLEFDSTMLELARQVGMGRHPKQYQMGRTLNLGRGVGRQLMNLDGAAIDRDPGIELRQPGFGALFGDALRQYHDWIDKSGLPVAVEIVDEPREVPNPWNRNLADTIAYAKFVHDARLTGFVTPMADIQDAKDYTVLADYSDIISVHAWKRSEGLIARTKKDGHTLWLYNTGMDRFSWGFYNWRVRSEGRWEWHFSWPEDHAKGGYPGREWYNPFTASHGMAPYAPVTLPGGMLYSSAFLDVCEGINDFAYIYTLERAIERWAKEAKHAETVKAARALLDEVRRAIPPFPAAKGLAEETDAALVGKGLEDDARLRAPEWRARIAAFLKTMSK